MKSNLTKMILCLCFSLISVLARAEIRSAHDLEERLKKAQDGNNDEIQALMVQKTHTGAIFKYIPRGAVADERLGPAWMDPDGTYWFDPLKGKQRGSMIVEQADLEEKCASVGGKAYSEIQLMALLKHLGHEQPGGVQVPRFLSLIEGKQVWSSTLDNYDRAFAINLFYGSYGWHDRENEYLVLCGRQ